MYRHRYSVKSSIACNVGALRQAARRVFNLKVCVQRLA